jgi:uncharacterized coiled-coil DUF342 family protein
MPIIIDETRHDDPAFMKAQIHALKENLTNCHNELQMVYGELSKAKKEIKALKVELSIHGVELK